MRQETDTSILSNEQPVLGLIASFSFAFSEYKIKISLSYRSTIHVKWNDTVTNEMMANLSQRKSHSFVLSVY